MANEVTTTLVVNFRGGSASDGAIDAEVDDREEGLNGGRTSFVRGDSPVYLVFRTDDIQLVEQTPSAGFISSSFDTPVATGEVTLTEELRFVKEQQASVTRPIKDLTLTSFKWIGNDLGTPQPIDAKTIQVPTFGVGVLKVTYQSKFEAYRIDNIPFNQIDPETDYSIVVFIRGIQV